MVRLAVDGFGASKRAAIKEFSLDVNGPKTSGPDGKIGVEDIDAIDKALASGKVSSGQRANLLALRNQVTRRPEADAAIGYILDGKRPINRLEDARKEGVDVKVNGKEVTVRLTDDDMQAMTVHERTRIIEATVNEEGYVGWWVLVPLILLFPIMFWLLFLDSMPWKKDIDEDRQRLLADLVNSTPIADQAELMAELRAKGLIAKAKENIPGASEFFKDAEFDMLSVNDKANALKNVSEAKLIERLNRIALTDGEAAQTQVGNLLLQNGTIRKHAPEVYEDRTPMVMKCEDLEDIKIVSEYKKDFANAKSADRVEVTGFVEQLPATLKKQVWDTFEKNHNENDFAAHLELRSTLQTCAHKAITNERDLQDLVNKINAVRTKFKNGDQIVIEEFDLLRAGGALKPMLPFIYPNRDPGQFSQETDILSREDWKKRLKAERNADLQQRDQFLRSLPAELHEVLKKDFEDNHFNLATTEAELNTYVADLNLEEIATRVVLNQTTANGAATILKRIEKVHGVAMKDAIARKVDWRSLLRTELDYTPSRTQGTRIEDIKNYADWQKYFTPIVEQHRRSIEEIKQVVPADVDKDLDAAFAAAHNMDRLVGLMEVEKTAQEVVNNFSGNATDFVKAMKKVKEKFGGNEAAIHTRIAANSESTINRLFGGYLDYPAFKHPAFKSPRNSEFRGNGETLNETKWQDYLKDALKTKEEWSTQFENDKAAHKRALKDLFDALPTAQKDQLDARFERTHDIQKLRGQVNPEQIGDALVQAALGGNTSSWHRWEDDWGSVKAALVELGRTYTPGDQTIETQMRELERTGMFDRLFPFVQSGGPGSHVVTTTQAEFDNRVRQRDADLKNRKELRKTLVKALDDLPMASDKVAGRVLLAFDNRTELNESKWETEIAKCQAEVKPEPQPQPSPQ